MTEPDPLPGLDVPDRPAGDVELAARRTIAALDEAGQIAEVDAVVLQALVTLARQYDKAANSTKAKEYAVANLHAQLLATIERLNPNAEGGDDDDPWTELERAAQEEVARRAAEAAARDTP